VVAGDGVFHCDVSPEGDVHWPPAERFTVDTINVLEEARIISI